MNRFNFDGDPHLGQPPMTDPTFAPEASQPFQEPVLQTPQTPQFQQQQLTQPPARMSTLTRLLLIGAVGAGVWWLWKKKATPEDEEEEEEPEEEEEEEEDTDEEE